MKHVKLFESFISEANVKKEAQNIADQIIDHIQDQINNDEEVDSAYYAVKDYFNSFDINYDRNPVFDMTLDLVDKWIKKNM